MAGLTGLFAAGSMALIGLVLGVIAYGAVLWLGHALAPQERAMLLPLVRRAS
jgi:hypothetical protein